MYLYLCSQSYAYITPTTSHARPTWIGLAVCVDAAGAAGGFGVGQNFFLMASALPAASSEPSKVPSSPILCAIETNMPATDTS